MDANRTANGKLIRSKPTGKSDPGSVSGRNTTVANIGNQPNDNSDKSEIGRDGDSTDTGIHISFGADTGSGTDTGKSTGRRKFDPNILKEEEPAPKTTNVRGGKQGKISDKDAKDVADGFLMAFNIGVVLLTEVPDAAVNSEEQERIHEPLERMIKRMSPKASKQFQTLTDPLAIAFGLSFWAMRVLPLIQQKADERKQNAARANLSGS